MARPLKTLLLILVSVVLCACADDHEEPLTTGQFGAVLMLGMWVTGVIANYWERRK
jgi:hypothetical protein